MRFAYFRLQQGALHVHQHLHHVGSLQHQPTAVLCQQPAVLELNAEAHGSYNGQRWRSPARSLVFRPHVAYLRSPTEEEYPPPGHGPRREGIRRRHRGSQRRIFAKSDFSQLGLVTGVVASDGQGAVSFRE
ncbi:unnamed protein product [Symbiodinium necroappetens]|uniref:Uncharacterized protein n=1 Tax=Symbiodinium necroappetens TaxID=1628268 RepID=A0A812LLX7_9DINO|nr:unnamed protein product [Symbiodinium necroappetens]